MQSFRRYQSRRNGGESPERRKTDSRPTLIKLAPGDLAMVVREDGSSELSIPRNGKPNDTQVMLLLFAGVFTDERVQELLVKAYDEKIREIEASSGGEPRR